MNSEEMTTRMLTSSACFRRSIRRLRFSSTSDFDSKITVLVLDPRFLYATLSGRFRRSVGEQRDIRWLDTFQYKCNPAETLKAIDSREREHLG